MIEIEKGKTLIVRLMAVGPVIEGRAQRDVWFEVNGEVRTAQEAITGSFLTLYFRSVRSLLRTRTPPSRPCLASVRRATLALWAHRCLVWSLRCA